MQAVIQIGSTQYLVEPGNEVMVDHLPGSGPTISFDKVLLTIDGSDVQIGQPYLGNVVVTADLVGDIKGEKIRVAKFKAKSRYRKTVGFRPVYTKIKIVSIGQPSVAPEVVKVKAVRKTKAKKSV